MSLPKFEPSLIEIVEHFTLPGHLISHQEIPTGLINHTHVATFRCEKSTSEKRFLFQCINSSVFPHPEKVMENIVRVTAHLASQNPKEEQLQLIPCREGRHWLTLPNGNVWRCYAFIEETETFVKIPSPELAFCAAAAFGNFQAKLAHLDPHALHETIPAFHHTPSYLEKLLQAAKQNPLGRLAKIHPELQAVLSLKALTTLLVEANLPIRITHNDTKISNILFPKDRSKKPIVIDLDTVMPGLSLFDYGDLVRSAASTADESETDAQNIRIVPEIKAALTEGYLSTTSHLLTPAEIALLPSAPQVITLELAIRFLTDYLLGDLYFRNSYPEQNLTRARNQLALLRSM